jgi:xanthine dehydrogenase YagR molybdenum-binding subunit
VFIEELAPTSSPMKAKGVGELGICGVVAAIANAIYKATGIRARHHQPTVNKLVGHGHQRRRVSHSLSCVSPGS